MPKTILNITVDENDVVTAEIPDMELAVMTVTEMIHENMKQGRNDLLNALFAVTVHLLARETSGKFQKQYIKNLEDTVPGYREIMRETVENSKIKTVS